MVINFLKSAINKNKENKNKFSGFKHGKVGIIIETTSQRVIGKIKFTTGYMGNKEWLAVSDKLIQVGEQAEVTAINGSILVIKKIEP